MPMSPIARVRMQVRGEVTPKIAELLYQADKGHLMAKLTDLSEAAQAVYLADALMFLAPEQRHERVTRVHLIAAQHFATKDDEQETVQRQARADVAQFGSVAAGIVTSFGTVRPGHCAKCKEKVTAADAFVLHLSESLMADVHGGCMVEDLQAGKVERSSPFAFRVIEGGGK